MCSKIKGPLRIGDEGDGIKTVYDAEGATVCFIRSEISADLINKFNKYDAVVQKMKEMIDLIEGACGGTAVKTSLMLYIANEGKQVLRLLGEDAKDG